MKFSDQFILKHKNTVLWLESDGFIDTYKAWRFWIEDRNTELTSVGIPSVVPNSCGSLSSRNTASHSFLGGQEAPSRAQLKCVAQISGPHTSSCQGVTGFPDTLYILNCLNIILLQIQFCWAKRHLFLITFSALPIFTDISFATGMRWHQCRQDFNTHISQGKLLDRSWSSTLSPLEVATIHFQSQDVDINNNPCTLGF